MLKWECSCCRGTPSPSPPLQGFTDAGFAKSACKILSGKGLKVKILILKELRCFLTVFPLPAPP